MARLSLVESICVLVLICLVTVLASSAQTFTTLMHFKGTNGWLPDTLVQGRDGSFYGTTAYGGTFYKGTVFKAAASSRLQLYSFCSQANCPDGSVPGGIALGPDGNFYGTTAMGGLYDRGTVFKITPTGHLTTLYSFCPQAGCQDGDQPSGLVLGNDGNFYGTTVYGGTLNAGTVFRIAPAGRLETLYRFCSQVNCSDGSAPEGNLIQADDGNFYGITNDGGVNEECGYLQNGCGTVFNITPEGVLTSLYRFCSSGYPTCPDGNSPRGGLVQAADGALYGTTYGIALQTGGTLFKIRSGVFSTLYTFCSLPGCTDGQGPWGELVQGTDGNLYGSTLGGGANRQGTTFKFSASSGVLTGLYSFCSQPHCDDGLQPIGVIQDTNGLFYGTTLEGGGGTCDANNGCGTIYSLDMGLAPFVAFVRSQGKVGQAAGILGQGFTGATGVSFNGIPANFSVVSDTFLRATIPSGATTGYVTVTTPGGTLTSNVPFQVIR